MHFLRKRPWPVHSFAIGFTVIALYNLIWGLLEIEESLVQLEVMVPEIDWNRDRAIVAQSARFTIVMIPVIAIWGFGSSLARLLVSLFALLSVPGIIMQIIESFEYGFAAWGLPSFISIAAFVLIAGLYTPPAKRWFSKEPALDPATFA